MVTMKHIHRLVQAHPLLDENLQWILESYCSLHCTFVFCSKLQQQVNSMPLMCAMICWEKMKTPIRKSRLM